MLPHHLGLAIVLIKPANLLLNPIINYSAFTSAPLPDPHAVHGNTTQITPLHFRSIQVLGYPNRVANDLLSYISNSPYSKYYLVNHS